MFVKLTRRYLLLLTLLTLSWAFPLFYVKSSDVASMREKIKQNKEAKPSTLFSTTEQQRTSVVKEIWLTQQDSSRLHYRIFSESSVLTIKPEGSSFNLIEKLEKIQCWMQDKLYLPSVKSSPMQQVRYFSANEGLYHYTSQQFVAQNVALSLYRLNGNELPQTVSVKPFLQGIAEGISFAVAGKNPQFEAKQFKAQLIPSSQL